MISFFFRYLNKDLNCPMKVPICKISGTSIEQIKTFIKKFKKHLSCIFLIQYGCFNKVKQCEKISEKKLYKICAFRQFLPPFWLDMEQALATLIPNSKFFFNKSNFVRPFYLKIWVGPECNLKKVN